MGHSDREAFICEKTKAIFLALKDLLRAGDFQTAMLVDEGIGAKLYGFTGNDQSIVQYHVDMANGINRYSQMVDSILQAEAENRALALADKAEQERGSTIAEYQFDLSKIAENMVLRSRIFQQ
jgi:hypothetical protein